MREVPGPSSSREIDPLERVTSLVALLDDPSDAIRSSVTQGLAQLPSRALWLAQDELAKAIRDEVCVDVLKELLRVSGRVAQPTPDMMCTLVYRLYHCVAEVRTAAIDAIRELGPEASGVGPVLISRARDAASDHERRRCLLAASCIMPASDVFVTRFAPSLCEGTNPGASSELSPSEVLAARILLCQPASMPLARELSRFSGEGHMVGGSDQTCIAAAILGACLDDTWSSRSWRDKSALALGFGAAGVSLVPYASLLYERTLDEGSLAVQSSVMVALARTAPHMYSLFRERFVELLSDLSSPAGLVGMAVMKTLAGKLCAEDEDDFISVTKETYAQSNHADRIALTHILSRCSALKTLPWLIEEYASSADDVTERSLGLAVLDCIQRIDKKERASTLSSVTAAVLEQHPSWGPIVERILRVG